MDNVTIFFLLLSSVVIIYLILMFKSKVRVSKLVEVLYLGIYSFIFLVFLYPNILNIIENVFGIESAINFILYLSIFVAYFIIFLLYRKMESQRVEITKLVREIALMDVEKRKK